MKNRKSSNKPKRYVCIAKIGNKPGGNADCIKHRLNDLVKYTLFLDKAFPGWRWFNVYDNRENKGSQLASFTKFRRPQSAIL